MSYRLLYVLEHIATILSLKDLKTNSFQLIFPEDLEPQGNFWVLMSISNVCVMFKET